MKKTLTKFIVGQLSDEELRETVVQPSKVTLDELDKALINPKLIRNMIYGLILNIQKFQTSDYKKDLTENFDSYLQQAFKQNDFEQIQVIVACNPNLKNNDKLSFLNAVSPIFKELTTIDTLAQSVAIDDPESTKVLYEFSGTVSEAIRLYTTDKIDIKALEQKVTDSIQDTINKLEKTSEDWTFVKNVLLTLTLIGPLLKRVIADDGKFFFENSTTTEFRNSLSQFRKIGFFQNSTTDSNTTTEEMDFDEENNLNLK